MTVTNRMEAAISDNNSTTSPESQYPIGTVSWQSAFWALVTIALNSCLQETGKICEIEAKLGLLVKSSPVFCAVDALIAWGQILYYLTRVRPREALRIVARSRQQHGTDTQEESRSISLIVSRCLLLLLAILQGLKLYALRGIPWTQVFGTMYLVSYATNALLNVLGKSQTAEDTPQFYVRRGDIQPSVWLIHCFAVVAAYFQIAIWTPVVRAALPDQWLAILERSSCRWLIDVVTYFGLTPLGFVFWLAATIPIVGAMFIDIAILLLPSAVVLVALNALMMACLPSLLNITADAFSCSVQKMRYTVAILFTFIVVLVQICFLPFPVLNWLYSSGFLSLASKPLLDIFAQWDTYTPYGLAFSALAVNAIISHFLHRVFFRGLIAQKLKVTSLGMSSNLAWACLFMFLANISLALLYYSHIYSLEGTWKPSWTENLGRKIV
jgi:hypothetical protein